MNLPKPTEENYYSAEMNNLYWSASQVKSMMKCQAAAVAEMRGEWTHDNDVALSIGSYVDRYIESRESFEKYNEEHRNDIYTTRNTKRAEYVKADEMIKRMEEDPSFMVYLLGDHQKIVTGEIAGVPFKAKLDAYVPGNRIVDLKTYADLTGKKKIWDESIGESKPFYEYWGWDLQMTIYQELIRQECGERLPTYLAVVDKAKQPVAKVYEVGNSYHKLNMHMLEEVMPLFDAIKRGIVEPERCEHCDYCRKTYRVKGAIPLEIIDMED